MGKISLTWKPDFERRMRKAGVETGQINKFLDQEPATCSPSWIVDICARMDCLPADIIQVR